MLSPDELLACAEHIAGINSLEATYRAAISRSYYAAYPAARDFHIGLSAPGDIRGATGRHQQLLNQLQFPNIPSKDKRFAVSIAIGKTLRQVYSARVHADYRLDQPVDGERMSMTLSACREVIRVIAGDQRQKGDIAAS